MSSENTSKTKGFHAEEIACRYLVSKGLLLVEKNFFCRFGELDLIMKEKDSLVFVEVKYKKNQDFASCISAVTEKKQKKVKQTALYYLHKNQLFEKIACRFDVVTLCGNISCPEISWLPSAFI